MTYSYTQISQYLTCPKRYRFRYLDGWKEKDTRATMLFGRAFEQALTAYFRRDDPGAVLFREWAAHTDSKLDYSNGATCGPHAAAGHPVARTFCTGRPDPYPPGQDEL